MDNYCDSILACMAQWSVREIGALTATVSSLAWSIGCSGRSFQIVSSPVVFIPFLCTIFHFCLTHLKSQSWNVIQDESNLRRALVQLLAHVSVNCKVKHVALTFIWSGLEALQGCRLQSVSGQPLLLLGWKSELYLIWFITIFSSIYFFIFFIALRLHKDLCSLILKSPFRYWKSTSGHLQNLLFFKSKQAQLFQAPLIGCILQP